MKEKKDFKDVYLFSDGCTGENQNCVMASEFSALAMNENINITQIFPVRGNSYCQCDRNFAPYGRCVKKTETIDTVEDYIDIICRSKKNGALSLFGNVLCVTSKSLLKTVNRTALSIPKYSTFGNLEFHPNYAQLTPSTSQVMHLSKKTVIKTTDITCLHFCCQSR